ncbi:hypothetical protein [Kitasatospora sp. NPDC097643]|uniref:hypothetical protein n=1 Tax=Kitasatospora sp. NPDC097643 TaxID=3157230 RepID=UPI0033257248
MSEQPGGMPSDPYRNGPPPPAFPQQPPAFPPPYGPPPGYGPSPAAKPSRTWLWVTLGAVVGALVVGGGAYALTGSDGTGTKDQAANAAPPAGSSGGTSGGGTAGTSGGGTTGGTGGGTGGNGGAQAPAPAGANGGGNTGGNGGAGHPMSRIQLPSSFQGMARNDKFPGMADLQKIIRDADPSGNSNAVVTVYARGEFGESHAIVVAGSDDHPYSEAERREGLAGAFKPNPMSPAKTVYDPVQTLDPGPKGGTLQCAGFVTKLDQPDAMGNTMYGGVQCVAIGTNTLIQFGENDELSGMDVAKAAEDLRKFRALAEVPR